MGSRRAAFQAGQVPKTRPIRLQKRMPSPTAQRGIATGSLTALPSRNAAAIPMITPTSAPISVRITASTRNWPRIERRRAPSALRTPISRVRSVTETSMMFMIPTPATSRAIEAIPMAATRIHLVIWLKLSMS